MTTKPTTVEELLDYWPGSIPFKGSLVSDDGCMCAQGQALHFLGGLTVEDLHKICQSDADQQVAELFGISRAHAILLRLVNDSAEGAPTCVIRNPEQVLGDQAQTVLSFWRHLDRLNLADLVATWAVDWTAAGAWSHTADWEAAVEAVGRAAGWGVAGRAARAAAWRAAGRAAGRAAASATYEIQGAAALRAQGQPFFFLPLFGFADPEAVVAADRANRGDA